MSDRVVQIAEEPDWGSLRGKMLACGRYLARNPSLDRGLVLLGALALFSGLGRFLIDVSTAAPLSRPAEHRRRARPFRSAPIRRGATSSPS